MEIKRGKDIVLVLASLEMGGEETVLLMIFLASQLELV